jgi:hypothetical protein
MCVSKDRFLELCDLFPQTKSNLVRKSLDRRKKFIEAKNCNSKKYWKLRGLPQFEKRPYKQRNDCDEYVLDQVTSGVKSMQQIMGEYPYMDKLIKGGDEHYMTDEEGPKEDELQEDIKIYLEKLNSKIGILTDAIKSAEYTIGIQTDPKKIDEVV